MGLLLLEQGTVGKQLQFHRSPARGRLMLCGNRSGKSHGGAREAAFWATGWHPWRTVTTPNIGWVVTLDRNLHLSVLRPKILSYLPPEIVESAPTGDVPEVRLKNGSIIRFKSCASGWEKFQAADVDWIWFDEDVPKEVFRECRIRLIDRRGSWWMSLTPVSGISWIFHDLYQPALAEDSDPKKIQVFSWSTYENTTLSRDEIDEAFADVSEEDKQIRLYGRFVNKQGLIWPNFNEKVHVVDPFEIPRHWPVVVGLDPGYQHPFGAAFCAVADDGGIVVWASYRKSKALASQHAKAIVDIFEQNVPWKVNHQAVQWNFKANQMGPQHDHADDSVDAHFVIDPAAIQVSRELHPYGISPRSANRKVLPGIERVGELLQDTLNGGPGIRFMRGRCNQLIEEMRTYSWKVRKNEAALAVDEPQNINDDVVDALRYAVMTRPSGATRAAEPMPYGSFNWWKDVNRQAREAKQQHGYENVPEFDLIKSLSMGKGW